MHLALIDWAIVFVYAVVVVTIGLRAARRAGSSEGYFLANRQLRWPFIGASLFASNISAEHFVGLAGSGFAMGLAVGGFEWMAVFCLVPLIVLFLPFYMRNRIYTVPEFLEKRFSPGVRLLFSGLMVVLSVLTKISISLWASSIVFSEVLGWNKLAVIWAVGLFTALYTMKGGLSAVVYTDALQTAVLLLSAVVLTVLGLSHVGGWAGLHARLPATMFEMVKPATHPDVPWPGMFVGVFLVGSFYWSMDQVLVQRVFAARDLNEGRLGATFCGYLKITTPFLLVLPGLIARALFPNLSSPDKAYPALLQALMPAGLLGLTVAGIAAGTHGSLERDVQLGRHAADPRFLLALAPGRVAGTAGARRTMDGAGSVRARRSLGAGHRTLRVLMDLSAKRGRLPDDTLRRRVLPRCSMAPGDDTRRDRGADHRVRRRAGAPVRQPAAIPAFSADSSHAAVAARGDSRVRPLSRSPGRRKSPDPTHQHRATCDDHGGLERCIDG